MLYHRYAWSTTRFKCSFQLTLRSGLATSGKMNMTGRIKCKNRMFVSIYLNIFNRYDVSLMQCQWYMYIYSLPTTITSFYHQGSIKLFMTLEIKNYTPNDFARKTSRFNCRVLLHTGMCGGKSVDVVFVSACCTIANERYWNWINRDCNVHLNRPNVG